MPRHPVAAAERKVLEALHESSGELLAAKNVAEAYFARSKLVRSINDLRVLGEMAQQRIAANRRQT